MAAIDKVFNLSGIAFTTSRSTGLRKRVKGQSCLFVLVTPTLLPLWADVAVDPGKNVAKEITFSRG